MTSNLDLKYLFRYFFIVFILFCSCSVQADISAYFNTIQNNPNALYAFFKEMPKGGELHYHLSGGAYPEEILNASNTGSFCLDFENFNITNATGICQLPLEKVHLSQSLYNRVIRAWSMKDFIPGNESASDHFFATFYKFMPLMGELQSKMLAAVMQRAANQNEMYLEILMHPREGQLPTFDKLEIHENTLEQAKNKRLADPHFQAELNKIPLQIKQVLQEARSQELHCTTSPQQPVCNIQVTFQYYILRQQEFDKFFTQALLGFAAAAKTPEIVAINLVQDEGSYIALKDYHRQMLVIQYLHNLYPQVHISLHAGELSPQSVAPQELRYHIREAIFIGQAERIGHGIDIAFENEANSLAAHMASKSIPVEINLTSNKKIYNIKGKDHPLHFYLRNKVPVVLSTDDEGILRTDLSREYVTAVIEQDLDYSTLKNINRNTLSYSFLPGKSIWQNNATYVLVEECQKLESDSCQKFISQNEKAKLQWRLEAALEKFENQFSNE